MSGKPVVVRVRIRPLHVRRRASLLRHEGSAGPAGHRWHPRRLRVHRGRARLISTGTGDRDSTGGLETVSFFFGRHSRRGSNRSAGTAQTCTSRHSSHSCRKTRTEASSRSTTLAPAVASTTTPELGPCAAADECHGAGTEPPPPAGDRDGRQPRRRRQPADPTARQKKHRRSTTRSTREAPPRHARAVSRTGADQWLTRDATRSRQ